MFVIIVSVLLVSGRGGSQPFHPQGDPIYYTFPDIPEAEASAGVYVDVRTVRNPPEPSSATNRHWRDFAYEVDVGDAVELSCAHRGAGWTLRWSDEYGFASSAVAARVAWLRVPAAVRLRLSCVAERPPPAAAALSVTLQPRRRGPDTPREDLETTVKYLKAGEQWAPSSYCYGFVQPPRSDRGSARQLVLPARPAPYVITNFTRTLNGTTFDCVSYELLSPPGDITSDVYMFQRTTSKFVFYYDATVAESWQDNSATIAGSVGAAVFLLVCGALAAWYARTRPPASDLTVYKEMVRPPRPAPPPPPACPAPLPALRRLSRSKLQPFSK